MIMTGVTVHETLWITLADGTRLAARAWIPDTARTAPVPAILEYLPYRRRDRHRGDDAFTHPGFAARGYAAIRVDMRGSGDSDGVMHDEYTPQEWQDACEVIAWIASQPWCSGKVGMIGLSWSGFNALQVAALRPPALAAIVTACASDDRYGDDMHYRGGCLLADNLQYGATLFTWLATPPDPAVVGDRWRAMWRERLEAVAPPALEWMLHPRRDAYWRSGSVVCDPAAITVPVLAVGGWSDGYHNAILRLLERLSVPRKGLIGPWGHAFPHVATPGPRIDFLGYVTRWWDHWLKGIDTGLMDEPMLTYWMQESEPPRPSYVTRRGHWAAQRVWPSPDVAIRRLSLGQDGRLAGADMPGDGEGSVSADPLAVIVSPPDLGTASGEWCPYGWGPDMPLDQRGDDAGAALFDGAPLTAPLALLGGTRVELEVSTEPDDAILAVRLEDVSPDGVSRRITYGLANLALVEPAGENPPRTVALALDDIAYTVPAGHRLRLAVSTAYWPLAVGTPHPVRLAIHGGSVALPVLEADGAPPPPLGAPDVPAYPESTQIEPPERGRRAIIRDLVREETRVEVVRNLGAVRLSDVDLELYALGSETYTMPWRDPGASSARAERLARFRRQGWEAEVRTRTSLAFEGADYRFEASIEAFEDGRKVFGRSWNQIVPRIVSPGSSVEAEES